MKNVLDRNVTLFKSYTTNTGGIQVNLFEYLQCKKHYEKQLEIAKLKLSDEFKYKKAKGTLPCILPSCANCTERRKNIPFVHTGLIQIDLDGKDNPLIKDWCCVKNHIIKIPNIAYCGLSVSGAGLWALVPISEPENHLGHFLFIENYFKALGLKIDVSCKNVQRLRGYAYDPNAYYNINAIELTKFNLLQKHYNEKKYRIFNNIGFSNTHRKVRLLIQQIKERHIDIAPDYDSYLKLAFCFASEFGVDGECLFLEVCSQHQEFVEKEAIAKYKNALTSNSGSVSIGTFFYLCKIKGLDVNILSKNVRF